MLIMNRGGCLCGAVQFETGPLASMVHCHCSMCRKHHGSMFATFLTGAPDSFRWLAGEDRIETYKSSHHGLRPFCRTCGSVVPSVLPLFVDFIFVPAGGLEGDPGQRPVLHMFAASRASWFPITDSLPQHAAFPPEFASGEYGRAPGARPKAGVIRGHCLCNASPGDSPAPPRTNPELSLLALPARAQCRARDEQFCKQEAASLGAWR